MDTEDLVPVVAGELAFKRRKDPRPDDEDIALTKTIVDKAYPHFMEMFLQEAEDSCATLVEEYENSENEDVRVLADGVRDAMRFVREGFYSEDRA